ncbi:MAG TPA: hypothetical protein VJ845_03950 [Haploplasma sp.]|nr:hypothetical protein [Haploplasma sp.]
MKSNEEIRVPKGKYSEQEIERRVRNTIANSAIEGIILTNEEIDRNKKIFKRRAFQRRSPCGNNGRNEQKIKKMIHQLLMNHL